jgi:hypothetical protein
MGAAEDGRFDVLIAADPSRFSRKLQQTVNAVEDHLHPAGVALLSPMNAC